MLVVLAFAAPAIAAPTYDFVLSNVTGTWSNPAGPGASTVNYNATNHSYDWYGWYGNKHENLIRWGESAYSYGGSQSGLGFTGSAGSYTNCWGTHNATQSFNEGEAFQLGKLRHINEEINSGTELTGATLTMSLAFNTPAGLTDIFNLDLTIDETPNGSWKITKCGKTWINKDVPDEVSFPEGVSQTFQYGDTLYTLLILGFKEYNKCGGATGNYVSYFQTGEDDMSCNILWGKITTEKIPQVPVPAPFLLLGSGLLGLFGIRRKVAA